MKHIAVWSAALLLIVGLAPARADEPSAAEGFFLQGVQLEREQRHDGAIAAFQRAIDEGPSPVLLEAMWRSAAVHVRLSRRGEACRLFEKIATVQPPGRLTAPALETAARLRHEAGDLDGAEEFFAALEANHPDTDQALRAAYWLALISAEDNRVGPCLEHVDRLLQRLEGRSEQAELLGRALLLKCRVLARRERWQELSRAAETPRNQLTQETQTELAYWRAEAAYRTGRFEQAESLLGALHGELSPSANPFRDVVGLRLGQLAARRQRWQEALRLTEGIEAGQFELSPELHYLRGRALAGRGEFPAAREQYRRVLQDPRAEGAEIAAMAQWMIGETFFHQRDFERARAELAKVIDEHHQPEWQARAALEIGKCHELEGAWGEAAGVYRVAAARWPGSPVDAQLRGRLEVVKKD